MSSLTKSFMNIARNNASKDSPVVVEIENSEDNTTTAISTTNNIVDVDVDVDVHANTNTNTNTNTNIDVELARMKDELQQLRRDRDHWRETAISNLAIETSKMKTRSSSPSCNNSENNNSNNNNNSNDNNSNVSNRKRPGVPFGCDDNNKNNNNSNLKGIQQFRSQAAATAAVTQQVDENETTETDEGTVMHFESTTTNKRQKRKMSNKDGCNQKSFHLMVMERHLKSAMIYASKGDKKLMLYSIKHAEKHANKKNGDDDNESSSSSSSCIDEIFLNKVAKIKQTFNKDLENSFHRNTMERQLRSAMAHAIRGDKSTVEYFLKEAEINARKCCCNDINRDDDDEGNGYNSDYSYRSFRERVTKIQEEIKRTIHGQYAL